MRGQRVDRAERSVRSTAKPAWGGEGREGEEKLLLIIANFGIPGDPRLAVLINLPEKAWGRQKGGDRPGSVGSVPERHVSLSCPEAGLARGGHGDACLWIHHHPCMLVVWYGMVWYGRENCDENLEIQLPSMNSVTNLYTFMVHVHHLFT